jgi:TetR/AcrR family transcriptional regulator, transcriptional repressor for nem operon
MPIMSVPTKQRLIEAGLRMLLERGYGSLGVQALLDETGIPKGSFYYHFKDKEDFALQVIDAYIAEVHGVLEACMQDKARKPLQRVRAFFHTVQQKYQQDGYLGCLMGGLGQELSGTNDAFRAKIEGCFNSIADRLAPALEEARQTGDIAPDCDVRRLADLLVDCWEGAALRSRLRRDPRPLDLMLDFYLSAVAAGRS